MDIPTVGVLSLVGVLPVVIASSDSGTRRGDIVDDEVLRVGGSQRPVSRLVDGGLPLDPSLFKSMDCFGVATESQTHQLVATIQQASKDALDPAVQFLKLPSQVGSIRGMSAIRSLRVDPASLTTVKEWSFAEGKRRGQATTAVTDPAPPSPRLLIHASRGLVLLESAQDPDTWLADVHAGRSIADLAMAHGKHLELAWHVVLCGVLGRSSSGDALHLFRIVGLECFR